MIDKMTDCIIGVLDRMREKPHYVVLILLILTSAGLNAVILTVFLEINPILSIAMSVFTVGFGPIVVKSLNV